MCGISCVFHLGDHSPKATDIQQDASANVNSQNREREKLLHDLDQSLDKIKHRGPDARGHWLSADNRVGTLVSPLCASRVTVADKQRSSRPCEALNQ